MFRKTKVCQGLMLAFGGTLALGGLPAHAQQQLERVEITGSSIKRIDAETALPVTIINRAEIERTGASNVQELVDRISSNNGGGRSLGESVGETSATGQTGASLRGLGRARTLVLLNGRRLSPYPFSGLGVDLNAVPLAAIERIEVLRDGASAVYGSDAIGGVINFITRKDLRGGEVAVGYEQPQKKGGKVATAAVAFGFGDLAKDRFNVLGSLSIQDYKVVRAADRDFAQTGRRPDIGVVKDSGNTFPANATIPAGAVGPNGIFVPGASNFPTCNPPDSYGGAANCRYDFTHYIDIYPASKRFGALVRGAAQVTNDIQLFAEVSHSKNEITFGSSQTPSTTTGKPAYQFPGADALGNLSPYYPTAAVDAVAPGYRGPLNLSWRIVDGGQRTDKVTNEQTRLVFGTEGQIAGFDYKAAVMSAEAKATDEYVSGWYSDPELRAALATGLVNPFGPNDAAGLAALRTAEIHAPVRQSKTKVNGFDAQVSKELFQMSGGALAAAIGVDTRKETYEDGYTELAGSGNIVGGSGNAGKVTGERSVTGLFAEVNVPVIKGLEVTGAVRVDKYSGTKGSSRDGEFVSPDVSATSPKLSLRWQPTKELLVRGSIGKGFRAPPLDNLYAPSSFTNTGGNFTDPFYDTITGCAASPDTDFCNTQLTALNESNPNLKPEKSKQYSLGLVFEPVRDLSLTIDYFNIEITNGITALTGDIIMNDWLANQTGPTTSSSVYADRLIIDPTTGYLSYIRASLENVGKAKVAGFDMSARYRMRTSWGTVTPGWEATYLTKSTTSNVVTGEEDNTLAKYESSGPVFRLKQNVTLDVERGAWAAGVRYYWQSGYEDYDEVRRVGTYELWDLQGQYKGVKNLTLTAGIRNLLDRKPPTTVQEDYFQVGFDPTYADVKGRTFYMRANYKF
jgi:iron complex outermembrane receptor protein